MSQHSPSPWMAVLNDEDSVLAIYHMESGKQIAGVYFRASDGTDDIELMDRSTSQANAALIAAAPELLAACQLFINWRDDGDTSIHEVEGAIRGAMSLAREGREQ